MKRKPFGQILFFLLLMLGCRNSGNIEFVQEENSQTIEPESKLILCQPRDTVTNDGFFVKYYCTNEKEGKFTLVWGNQKFVRHHNDTSICIIDGEHECDYLPHVEFIDREFIYLKKGGDGSSPVNCEPITFEQIVLPKNNTDSVLIIPLYIKTENNFSISSNGCNKIILTNHLNQTRQEFKLIPSPSMVWKTVQYSIDSLEIRNKELYVAYKRYDENDELIILKRKFNIE